MPTWKRSADMTTPDDGSARTDDGSARTDGCTNDEILEVLGATVRFGGVTALDDVGLTVGRREVVGVIGPNGAGKTTLFDLISGFRRPTSGSIRLLGADVTNRAPAWRSRHGLRRTFQRQQVFTALSVRENLLVALEGEASRGGIFVDALGLSGRRRSGAENERRVEAALYACQLDAVRDVSSGSLPIGIARRIELARALVHEPRLLLLDEPTSGLDEAETEIFSAALQQHKADHDTSVLLVEHDVGFVMDHSDRIVVMNLGRVIADASPSEVRADPAVQKAYLG